MGDTIALRPQCRSLGHYHVWIWRKLSLRQRRHKVAASKYSGLRGSREPDEVQAVIIGVMKLLVSQFIILQSDSIRFSGFMARDEILDHFYKRSGFKWESFRACNSFTMLCNCFFIENFNGLRLLKSLWSCYWKIHAEVKSQQYRVSSVKVSPVNVLVVSPATAIKTWINVFSELTTKFFLL